jgi:hypothetical protein
MRIINLADCIIGCSWKLSLRIQIIHRLEILIKDLTLDKRSVTSGYGRV